MVLGKVWLCDKPWWQATVAAALFFSGLAYTLWSTHSPVLDYGAPGQTYLVPSTVVAGQRAQLCFAATEWKRICPSEFSYYTTWTDEHGALHRLDADSSHAISPPTTPRKLPLKCRPIRIQPELPPGEMTMHAWATSQCAPLGLWSPLTAQVPDIKYTIRAPGQ